jgi:phosphatidylinositol alpha 1,6-mannosyltransferase
MAGPGGGYLSSYPRVAFLPDTFSEVNGVAHTARHLEAFARVRQIPFLSVHCGPRTERTSDGAVSILQLKRSPARIGLDANLDCDLLLMRYAKRVIAEVRGFGAELIHITGPGDMGALGAFVSWSLSLPLVISWHTSLHEYAGARLRRLLSFSGKGPSNSIGNLGEKLSIEILRQFYRRAVVTMAPNPELVDLTHSLTGRPAYLMRRGVDTELFDPSRRHRSGNAFRIGYVGRLTPEKNVRFLADLGAALLAKGYGNFEFMMVGEGSEEHWLRAHVPKATFTGVLRGATLAQAYANMDLFAFPSHTDTFGNVVLEALASAVPAVVTDKGGPKFLVEHGVTGYIAANAAEFVSSNEEILTDPIRHANMRRAARAYAARQCWDTVFESVFRAYADGVQLYAGARLHLSPSLLSSRVHGRGSSRWEES